MTECKGFTLARRGYNCSEVDDFVTQAQRGETELRDSYASLQQKYDALCDENTRLKKEKDRVSSDCTTLALALKQLRESTDADSTDYKEKYETALAELESMKAIVIDDGYRIKYEQVQAELDRLREQTAQSEATPEQPAECNAAASRMVTEIADVVKKLERDARRKAEAIVLSAKLEQAQSQLIKSRVLQEVKSLTEMLECYLRDHPDEEEN